MYDGSLYLNRTVCISLKSNELTLFVLMTTITNKIPVFIQTYLLSSMEEFLFRIGLSVTFTLHLVLTKTNCPT